MKLQISKLASLMAAGTLLLSVPITSLSAEYVSVVKDGVNVRTGPSTTSPVYMEIYAGYPLEILEKKDGWYKVQDFENDSGWIYEPLTKECTTVIVNVSNKVNMRSTPDTDSSVVATIERGVVLDLLKREGKWVQARHISGAQGWIYAPLVWP